MSLTMTEYIEVNLIGIIMLLTMMLYTGRRWDWKQWDESGTFIIMAASNTIILFADIVIYLLRGHGSPEMMTLTHIACVVYFFLGGVFCYEWVRYVFKRLYPLRQATKREHWILQVPVAVNSLVILASPATGWIYSLSDTNVYHRGPLIWLPFIIGMFYWIFSTAIILGEYRHSTQSREPGVYRTLFAFPLFFITGNLLQMRFYGLSITWVCAAVSMVTLFMERQKDQLSRDILTGLFNRRQTGNQLAWELGRLPASQDYLMVAILDVDHFKDINDRFGHLMGDQALIQVARILGDNARRSDFVSRFGGDEFLLVGHVKDEDEARQVLRKIGEAVDTFNGTGQAPYTLSLSMGYALRSARDKTTVDAILDEADKKMYLNKDRTGGCRR